MDDIISVIDQAVGCQTCGGSLERSVSDMFCGESCQQAWHAKRVTPASSFATPVDFRAALERDGYIIQEWQQPWLRAHFEIREDGGIVDNTAAIRSREIQVNMDMVSPLAWEAAFGLPGYDA